MALIELAKVVADDPAASRRWAAEPLPPTDRLSATHPNHVWALDYQFDVTASGRIIKILHVTDEFTRESLSDLVATSIDADTTVDQLDRIAEESMHDRWVHTNPRKIERPAVVREILDAAW